MVSGWNVIGSVSATANASTSAAVTLPTWVVGPDTYIFVMTINATQSFTCTTPAGYALLSDGLISNQSTRSYVWYRKAQQGDSGTTITPVFSGSSQVCTAAVVISGVLFDGGFDAKPTGSGSIINTPNSKPSSDQGVVLYMYGGRGNADGTTPHVITFPPNHTNTTSINSTAASANRNSYLSTGTKTYMTALQAADTATLDQTANA